ncbi:hypothetical protein [Rhodococcus opacus]|uniref:Uncharacterized protein n=1 Tax=Rhodococcus opacus (strain B4) TaxID=632772 RepID=C1B9C9_RHOOB|nr:hypothetical protein [Rhodococcus opacus]BAH52282.1 hypothetical protein ROP_40350 [Rhodococcus opacus B4]
MQRDSIVARLRRQAFRCPISGDEISVDTSVAVVDRLSGECLTVWSTDAWDECGGDAIAADVLLRHDDGTPVEGGPGVDGVTVVDSREGASWRNS